MYLEIEEVAINVYGMFSIVFTRLISPCRLHCRMVFNAKKWGQLTDIWNFDNNFIIKLIFIHPWSCGNLLANFDGTVTNIRSVA